MFAGLIKFADRCPGCGLVYEAYNVGDEYAAFLTLILGAIVAGMAIAVELIFFAPWWSSRPVVAGHHLALLIGSAWAGTPARLRISQCGARRRRTRPQ